MMLLPMILLLLFLVKASTSLNVTISDLRQKEDLKHTRLHRKDITFQGSHIESIALHKTQTHEEAEHWQVEGRLILAIPNRPRNLLINSDEISGAVVLFDYAEDSDVTYTFCELKNHNAAAAIIVDTSKEEKKKTALHIVRQANEERWELCNLSNFHSVVVTFEDGKRLKDRCVVSISLTYFSHTYVCLVSDTTCLSHIYICVC